MRKNLLYSTCISCGIIAILISMPLDDFAQSVKRQVISSYGSSGQSDKVSIRQTAGQSFNTVVSLNDLTISPGFQQPSSFVLEEIAEPLISSLDVLVFPNPATRSITITSKSEISSSLIQVIDVNGRTLLIEKVPNMLQHKIDCTNWVNGVYMITISDTAQNKKTIRLMISK